MESRRDNVNPARSINICTFPRDLPPGFDGPGETENLCGLILRLRAVFFLQHGPCHVCFVNVPLRDTHGLLVDQLLWRSVLSCVLSIRCLLVSAQVVQGEEDATPSDAAVRAAAIGAGIFVGGCLARAPPADHTTPSSMGSFAGFVRARFTDVRGRPACALFLRFDLPLGESTFPVAVTRALHDALRAYLESPDGAGPIFFFASVLLPCDPPVRPRAIGRLSFGDRIATTADLMSVCGQLYRAWREARAGDPARALGNICPFARLASEDGGARDDAGLLYGPSHTGGYSSLLSLFDPQRILDGVI